MSDTMLHSILQMPPEFWTSGATDIAQRHSRYLEASKRISQLEYERCEASRERDDAIEELARVRRELVAANRGAETNAKVNQGLCTRLAEAERERDEARRDLVAAEELHRRRFGTLKSEYDAACAILAEAERERDQARGECNEAQDGWSRALDERDEAREELARVRKELAASNLGAERNAKVNQGLCSKLAEAEAERDEARRELAAAAQRLSLWEGAVMRMKKQLSFALPFRTEEAK